MKKAKIIQTILPDNLTIEEKTYLCIGKLTVLYSILEGNINLAICEARWPEVRDDIYGMLNKMNFGTKVTHLFQLIDKRPDVTSEIKELFKKWVSDANEHRETRNSFIHGRWGFAGNQDKIFHIQPSVYGQTGLETISYSIEELIKEVTASSLLLQELNELRSKIGI